MLDLGGMGSHEGFGTLASVRSQTTDLLLIPYPRACLSLV